MVLGKRSQVTGDWGQDHGTLRKDVKLFKGKALRVLSQSAAFYKSYYRKKWLSLRVPTQVQVKTLHSLLNALNSYCDVHKALKFRDLTTKGFWGRE